MINVGKRIRELRKKKGLTLLELSKKSGVALATLSRMETGKMTGTFESHVSISKALDLSLPEFYSELDKPTTLQKDGDYGDLFVHDKKATSVILTKDIFAKKMLPMFVRLEHGGRTHKEQFKKGTEKFLYVMDGKIEVIIGDEHNTLSKNDTLYFDASHEHYMRNAGNSIAKCITVVTPVTL